MILVDDLFETEEEPVKKDTTSKDMPLEVKVAQFHEKITKQISFEVTGGEQWDLKSELLHSNLKEILNENNFDL